MRAIRQTIQRITPSEQIWHKGLERMSEESYLEQSHILSTFWLYGNWVNLDSEVYESIQSSKSLNFLCTILISMINMLSYFDIPSVLKI